MTPYPKVNHKRAHRKHANTFFPRPKKFVRFCTICGKGYKNRSRKNKDLPYCESHLKSVLQEIRVHA